MAHQQAGSPGGATTVPAPHHVLRSEVDGLARVLAASFADDPMFVWMCPELSVPERAERLVTFFGPVLELARRRGHAYATDDAMAAALWSPPEVELYDGEGLDRIKSFFVEVVGDRAGMVGGALDELNRRHPTRPHFYLAVLGTHPDRQGHGLGSVAMQPVLRACDETGTLAYLESSNIRNVPFYERHGFRVIEEVTLPDGPIVRPMTREPEPPGAGRGGG